MGEEGMANFRVDFVKLESLAKRLGVASSDSNKAQTMTVMHNDSDHNKSAVTVDLCELLEAILNIRTESGK